MRGGEDEGGGGGGRGVQIFDVMEHTDRSKEEGVAGGVGAKLKKGSVPWNRNRND